MSDLVSKKFNSFGISLFLYHKHINSNFELVVKWRKFEIMGDSMKILPFFIFESQFPKNKKLTFGGLDNEKHLCILLKNITLIWYKYTYKTKNVD